MDGLRARRRATLALGVTVACVAAAPAYAQEPEVVADGLSNPRGMTFAPNGKLFVAESGRGGRGGCITGPEGEESCYGATGAVSQVNVRSGKVRRVIRRLPSHAAQTGDAPGADATGPNDVSFRGRTLYFTLGLGANPAARRDLGRAGRAFAALYRVNRRGRIVRVADLGAYEAENNPDNGQPTAEVDSNPYSVDATGRGPVLVTDAGGNDLLSVSTSGRVRTLAVFPFGMTLAPPFLGLPPGTEIPYQPVPTGVVRTRSGAWVGTLTGFPFPVGGATVYSVPAGGEPVPRATGFTNIVDIARGPGGSVYVLQLTTTGLAGPPSPGKLVRVGADGSQTELAAGQLQQPTGLAVARNGDVYVATDGSSPDDAAIVRVEG